MTGNVNLYNVFVGDFASGDSPETMAVIDALAANIGGSSWLNMMTSYYQVNGDNSRTYMSNSATHVASINIHVGEQGTNMNEPQLITELISLFNAGTLPVDTNGVYAVILRGDFTYDGWLSYWCGYHTAFYLNDGRIIKFLLVGDPSTAPNGNGAVCEAIGDGSPTANGNLGADSMASIYSHELVETTSDYLGAWYFDGNAVDANGNSLNGEENADACVWNFGDFTGNSNVLYGPYPFLVQQNWVPGYGCRMTL